MRAPVPEAMKRIKTAIRQIPVLGPAAQRTYRFVCQSFSRPKGKRTMEKAWTSPSAALPASAYQYKIGQFNLYFPAGHGLRLIQSIVPTYDRAWRYIVKEIAASIPGGTFIDIGANVGDTAALFADCAPSVPIICVEGAKNFLPYLYYNAKQIGRQVTVVDKFIQVNELDKQSFVFASSSQTGGFVKRKDAMGTEIDRDDFITLRELKNKHSPRSPVALFKSDTDGFDPYIILENLDFFKEENSCLFFEYDPIATIGGIKKCGELIRRLEQENYGIIVFDNHGRLMFHAEIPYALLIEELLQWINLQAKIGARHIYYLDLWAFPPDRHEIFHRLRQKGVAEIERELFLDPSHPC
jgi:FkbM family methyltransferase